MTLLEKKDVVSIRMAFKKMVEKAYGEDIAFEFEKQWFNFMSELESNENIALEEIDFKTLDLDNERCLPLNYEDAEKVYKRLQEFIEKKIKPMVPNYCKTTGEIITVTQKGIIIVKAPKMLIYNRGNTVACKINLGDRMGYTYHQGSGRSISRNKGKDREEYPYLVSMNYLEEFLYLNKVEDYIEIDPNSIDEFYNFENKYFVKPTEKWVNTWWNYDCPYLYRYIVNKERKRDVFGINPVCRMDVLVEPSFSGAYIGDDITKEEVAAFTRNRENTGIAKEMEAMLEARNLNENKEEVERLEKEVKSYEAKVQKVIDENEQEILQYMYDKNVLERKEDGDFKEKFFGLDCGFLNIFTSNAKYNKAKRLLRNIDNTSTLHAKWMNLNLPLSSQSLTVKRTGFEIIKKLVEKNIGEELYCTTMLD